MALSHYLPTIELAGALNMVRVIEVAFGKLSSANTLTITSEPWNLKTIYQFIVEIFTGHIWVIISWPRCLSYLLYSTQVCHFGCIRFSNFNIAIPLGMRYIIRRVVNASRSVQTVQRIQRFFTAHENHNPW